MATKIICDGGCKNPLRKHKHDDEKYGSRDTCPRCKLGYEGVAVGRLDPVVYCPPCKKKHDAHVDAERLKRAELIADFESWRLDALAKLRADGFALPDDDAPDPSEDEDAVETPAPPKKGKKR